MLIFKPPWEAVLNFPLSPASPADAVYLLSGHPQVSPSCSVYPKYRYLSSYLTLTQQPTLIFPHYQHVVRWTPAESIRWRRCRLLWPARPRTLPPSAGSFPSTTARLLPTRGEFIHKEPWHTIAQNRVTQPSNSHSPLVLVQRHA